MPDRKAVLITRAEPGASETAARLEAMFYLPLVSPALDIVSTGASPDAALYGAAGLIFTSANGVRFFAAASDRRDLTAWCVGPATSEAAVEAGFSDIRHADGDAGDLFDLIAAAPDTGPLVHLANAHAAGDLAARLQSIGREVRFCALYDTVPASSLTPDAEAALAEGRVSAVLIHSAKGARAFAALAFHHDLSRTALVGLSQKALAPAATVEAGQRLVAERPNEDSLLAALHTALAAR